MLKRGAQKVSTLKKGGEQKFLPCLEGGGAQKFRNRNSHFVAPHPIINDHSLRLGRG